MHGRRHLIDVELMAIVPRPSSRMLDRATPSSERPQPQSLSIQEVILPAARGAKLLRLAFGALLLVACSKGETVVEGAPSVDPSDYPDTISRMVNGTTEEVDALDRLQFAQAERRVRDCMVEAGFGDEYIPGRLFQGTSGPAPAYDLPFSTPLSMDEAEAHGWGIIERAMHPGSPPQIPPNGPRSKAYLRAQNSCENLRDSIPVTDYPQDSLSKAATDDVEHVWEAVFRDPAFSAALSSYRKCMARRGFLDSFNVLYFIEEDMHGAVGRDDQPKLESLLAEEVAFAVADATCRPPVYADLLAARARVEAPVIARHRDELKALKATWQDILERAPSREDVAALT
jgi:hypothetical protein